MGIGLKLFGGWLKRYAIARFVADTNLVDQPIEDFVVTPSAVVTANRNILIPKLRRSRIYFLFSRYLTIHK